MAYSEIASNRILPLACKGVKLMSSESSTPQPEPRPSYSYDDGMRIFEVREATRVDGTILTTYSVGLEPLNPTFKFTHDKPKGLFILSWSDGKVERFRDNPARELLVELDPETGEMRPVLKRGQPAYVYLCREERESR